MVKQIKKIKFTGFPDYHNPRKQPYFQFLSDRYNLIESDNPDYIIDGGQNFEHVKYNAIKILISSENDIPDFNAYDYAISSAVMGFGDRYIRIPWCAFSPYYQSLGFRQGLIQEKLLLRKFCSFVVSNAEFADPLRAKFFKKLCKYKKVDSGGLFMNNIGTIVKDKNKFCREYKFNIAFENSSSQGYLTEKIVDSYYANSIPIYYGDPSIEVDFSKDSMVYIRNEEDVERAIEEIIRLDGDDEAYLKKVSAPCFPKGRKSTDYMDACNNFLVGILEQPIDRARRLCCFGHQAMMRRHLGYLYGLDYRIGKSLAYRLAVKALGKVRTAISGV